MKRKNLKMVASAALALTMLVQVGAPVYAEEPDVLAEPSWKTGVKDHWSFEAGATTTEGQSTVASDQGTSGVLHDITVEETGNEVFGKALKFGAGTDKYMRLDDYINTGAGQTSFSMWYKYDTNITETNANASAVLLQHEDKNGNTGRTVLSLTSDGKYDTYLNATKAPTSKAVSKSDWQHITVVFDQNSKKVKYYINGELEGTEKNLGTTVTNATLPLRVGAHKANNSKDPHPMRGFVDEFYVYDRALNDEEAKSLYEDKAAELYKVDLRALIAEAEELAEGSELPDTDPVLAALKTAINEATAAVETADMDALKSAKETLENAINAYKAEQPIDLTINTENVTQSIDADSIFGINHRYAFNGYGTFDSEKMKMKDEFVALYEDAGFGSIRYPGGTISNLFNWKTTLGPKDQRKKQMHGFYNNPGQGGIAPNFGIGEIATFADNVDSEIIYVYSLGRGSAQDAADLVEYLNAEVGTNPNEGIDWAEVRSRNGHPEPYNVRYFEIGNEMNQGGEDGRTSQQYWTAYVDGGSATEKAYIDGGIARFNQRYTVKEEDWNKTASQSDGSENQVRYLMYANVNPGKLNEEGEIVVDPEFKAVEPGVEITVGTDGNTVPWTVVKDLSKSGSTDRHCEVDYSTGAIKFGDGVHGKIPEKGNNIYATYSVRRDGFTEISKEIKDTTAKINEKEKKEYAAHVYTSYESHSFFQKLAERNKEDLCDGMTIHPYSNTVKASDTDSFYDQAMLQAETQGIGKVKRLMTDIPEGKVPVISEYGIFRNTESQLRSQTHAIYIAKVLMEYVRLGSPYIQKHCLTDWYSNGADALGPTQQAVIQVYGGEEDRNTGESDKFKFFSTPSAHVFKMLNAGFGDNIVETEFSEVPTMSNGVETLSTLASMDESGNLYVAIVNADRENNRKIALNINGVDVTGRKMNVQRLESETITDENTPENKDKVTVTEDEEIELTGNPVINLEKHSFVTVKIETNEIVADKSELQAAVDSVEGLIKDHYTNFETSEDELAAAKEVLANGKATQDQVDKALANLRAAKAELVMKDAEYSKVDAAIAKAEKLNKKDYKDFSKVEEAIAAVVRGKKIDEQTEVDAMAQRIEDAIAALEKVEVPGKPEKPEKPEKPGKPEKPNGNKVPVTGDETTPILWMTLVVMSGAIIRVGKKRLNIIRKNR